MLGPNRNFNLAIGRAKLRGSAKVAFSVADSEIRWAELVPSRTVLTLSVQNGPACSKSALEKLGPIWPLGSIWLFSFYSLSDLSITDYLNLYWAEGEPNGPQEECGHMNVGGYPNELPGRASGKWNDMLFQGLDNYPNGLVWLESWKAMN